MSLHTGAAIVCDPIRVGVTYVFAGRETACFSVMVRHGTAGGGMAGDCEIGTMAVIYGWVTWTLMLWDFAYMTVSEMRMAVTLSH